MSSMILIRNSRFISKSQTNVWSINYSCGRMFSSSQNADGIDCDSGIPIGVRDLVHVSITELLKNQNHHAF